MKKHLLIDTSFLIYRSHFGYAKMNFSGQNLGATYGFFKTLISLVGQFQPDVVYFAFDSKEKTWRHKIFPDYKAGRAKMEDDMREQIPKILDMCKKVCPNSKEHPGYEADDLINTYITKNIQNGGEKDEFLIFSSDQDLYQILILPNVHFIKNGQNGGDFELFGLEEFYKKFELNPIQWVDYKALVGDNSDNLRGVSGVGPKTAIKFLQQGGDLQNIAKYLQLNSQDFLETGLDINLDFFTETKNQKVLEKIKNDWQNVVSTYKLARLSFVEEAQVFEIKWNLSTLQEDFQDLRFPSLLRTLGLEDKVLNNQETQISVKKEKPAKKPEFQEPDSSQESLF